MADRRMFAKNIINSGKFLKMPLETQALYFHLALNADDDGVVEGYNVLKSVGSSEDSLNLLITKEYVKLLNNDLVIFVVDWLAHNKIRSDRKKDSIYKKLLIESYPHIKLIEPTQRKDRPVNIEDGTSQGQRMVSVGEVRLGEVSKEVLSTYVNESTPEADEEKKPIKKSKSKKVTKKDITDKKVNEIELETNNIIEDVIDLFNNTCEMLPRVKKTTIKRTSSINARLNEYSIQELEKIFISCSKSDFLTGKNKNGWVATFDWVMNPNNIAKIFEGNYKNKKGSTDKVEQQNFKQRKVEEGEFDEFYS